MFYFSSLSSDSVKSHPSLLPAKMSVFVFFWARHLLLARIWRWEFIPAIPVSIFPFFRNKRFSQILHFQASKPSIPVISLTGSLDSTGFQKPENPHSSPTWVLAVTQLQLKWTCSPRVHPLRSTSIRSSSLAQTYDYTQHFTCPSHGCLRRKFMALPPREKPSYRVITSTSSPISHWTSPTSSEGSYVASEIGCPL